MKLNYSYQKFLAIFLNDLGDPPQKIKYLFGVKGKYATKKFVQYPTRLRLWILGEFLVRFVVLFSMMCEL